MGALHDNPTATLLDELRIRIEAQPDALTAGDIERLGTHDAIVHAGLTTGRMLGLEEVAVLRLLVVALVMDRAQVRRASFEAELRASVDRRPPNRTRAGGQG